jgi:hypothetical protein
MGHLETRNVLGSRALDGPHNDDNEKEEKEKED